MESLESLYRQVGPLLLAYLRRQVGYRVDAEELLQETFVVAAGRTESLDAAGSQRAWLFGVARNLVREHVRRKMRRPVVTLSLEPAAPAITQPDDRVEAMRSAIRRLPDAQKEVLELRLSQELSYAEIAEALSVPIGTVRSRLHNAVAALRDDLAAKFDDATVGSDGSRRAL